MIRDIDYETQKRLSTDALENRRLQKAQAFRAYVKAKQDAGETVDPLELDRIRYTMSEGNPFLASMIPAGEALNQLTDLSNAKASKVRAGIVDEYRLATESEYETLKGLIKNNPNMEEVDFAPFLAKSFGASEGPRLFAEYGHEFNSLQNQARAAHFAKVKQDERFKSVFSEDDFKLYYPEYNKSPWIIPFVRRGIEENKRNRLLTDSKDAAAVSKDLGVDPLASGVPIPPQAIQAKKSDAISKLRAIISTPAGKEYLDHSRRVGTEPLKRNWIAAYLGSIGLPTDAATVTEVMKELDAAVGSAIYDSYNQTRDKLTAAGAQYLEDVQKGGATLVDHSLKLELEANPQFRKEGKLDPRIVRVLDNFKSASGILLSPANINSFKSYIETTYLSNPSLLDNPIAFVQHFKSQAPLEDANSLVESMVNRGLKASGFSMEPRDRYDLRMRRLEERLQASFKELDQVIVDAQARAGQEDGYETMSRLKGVLRAKASKLKSVIDEEIQLHNLLTNGAQEWLRPEGFDPAFIHKLKGYMDIIKTYEKWDTNYFNSPYYGLSVSEYEKLATPSGQQNFPPNQRQPASNAAAAYLFDKVQGFLPQSEERSQLQKQVIHGTLDNATNQTHQLQSQIQEGLRNIPSKPESSTSTYASPTSTNTDSSPLLFLDAAGRETERNIHNTPLDSFLNGLAEVESNHNPFARAATSSAKGAFQFIDKTWNSVIDRYGPIYGFTRQTPRSPSVEKLMAMHLTLENASALSSRLGRPPTEPELYFAHFLGPSKAATLISMRNTHQLAKAIFPKEAQANPAIFTKKDGTPRTVGEVYDLLSSKITRAINNGYEEYTYNQNGDREP